MLAVNPFDGSFCGILSARDGREFPVRIVFAANDSGTQVDLFCGSDLRELLAPHAKVVRLRLNRQDGDGFQIGNDLEELVDRVLCASAEAKGSSSCANKSATSAMDTHIQFAMRVAEEIEALGWEKVSQVDDSMRRVEIVCHDNANRRHTCICAFPEDFPLGSVELKPCLPERAFVDDEDERELVVETKEKGRVLISACNRFQKVLEKYQETWDVLDDIDKNTWVLDPINPDRSVLVRRVCIAQHCSVHIQISAEAPRSVCECQFMGPESKISQIRQRFNDRIRFWDRALTVCENLEKILEINFPRRSEENFTEQQQECGICYSLRLPTEDGHVSDGYIATGEFKRRKFLSTLPDCICKNPKCGRNFHPACLREWLRSLPTTRHSFDTMFGDCPYCLETIEVRNS